jgi:hypothetical protein
MPGTRIDYLPLHKDMPQDDLLNEEIKNEPSYEKNIISYVHKLRRALTKTVEQT